MRGLIKLILRSIGYIIISPVVVAFAACFGIPALLAILIDYGFEDGEFRDARLLSFTFIFALVQFAVLIYIAQRIITP